MNFKITNSDSSKFFPNRYNDWPYPLNNKNSRTFKKEFNYLEYEKIQILWQISNYLGPAPPRSMTFFYFSNDEVNNFVAHEISIYFVSKYLENNPIIDETYLPIEGDQLLIHKDYYYKSIKDISRPDINPNTISLIYKNGQWKEGNYKYEFDETKLVHSGILEI